MSIVVMKFGGTSVGSAKRINDVIDVVDDLRTKGHAPLVVLSAMSGVTNMLIEGAELALSRNLPGALEIIGRLRDKHMQAVNELLPDDSDARRQLEQELQERLDELAVLYKGVTYLGELSRRSLDAISGAGELLSSGIVAATAAQRGLPCLWADARRFVLTDDQFGKAQPMWEALVPAAREQLLPALQANSLVFTQGFIGSTAGGVGTTLGRGGSDYSASILGVAVDAAEIQIWTDVDGMMTADPRVVPEARVIPEVSFQEASELAYFGAKVLHPMTIRPAVEKDIPVRILNTMNPASPGTLIKAKVTCSDTIRAVAAKKKITAVYLSSPSMLMSHGYLACVFEIFDRYRIPVDLISTSEVSIALTIDTADDLYNLEQELSDHADVQIIPEVAIISVVGRQFRDKCGLAGRVFKALDDINILMISGGASDINLSLVVGSQDADKAVRQLHSEFFAETGV